MAKANKLYQVKKHTQGIGTGNSHYYLLGTEVPYITIRDRKTERLWHLQNHDSCYKYLLMLIFKFDPNILQQVIFIYYITENISFCYFCSITRCIYFWQLCLYLQHTPPFKLWILAVFWIFIINHTKITMLQCLKMQWAGLLLTWCRVNFEKI